MKNLTNHFLILIGIENMHNSFTHKKKNSIFPVNERSYEHKHQTIVFNQISSTQIQYFIKPFYFLLFCLAFLANTNEIVAQSSFINEVSARIDGVVEKGDFSGVVLYAKDNEILFNKAYGYADRENKIKNQPSFKFNLASVNKLFTKIAITKLIMEGKLELSSMAKSYVPELNKKGTEKITIKHLLTNSSGLGDYLSDELYISNKKKFQKMSDYLPLILDKELSSEPGSKKQYSNVGFELLGIIIERISKMDYYKYVQTNIFNVCGMQNTGYYTKDDNLKNLAIGYHKDEIGNLIPNWDLKSYKGTAAGGGYSTTEDMLKLAKALNSNKILDEKHMDLLCKKFEEGNMRYYYLSAAGGANGINARLHLHRTKNEVTIILSNQDPPSADNINEIFKELSNKKSE